MILALILMVVGSELVVPYVVFRYRGALHKGLLIDSYRVGGRDRSGHFSPAEIPDGLLHAFRLVSSIGS